VTSYQKGDMVFVLIHIMLFVSGYDVRTGYALDKFIEDFEKIAGLHNI